MTTQTQIDALAAEFRRLVRLHCYDEARVLRLMGVSPCGLVLAAEQAAHQVRDSAWEALHRARADGDAKAIALAEAAARAAEQAYAAASAAQQAAAAALSARLETEPPRVPDEMTDL